MIKVISYRSTFFLNRVFNVEKDIFSLMDIAKDFNLFPFLSPTKNNKQKLLLNFSRPGNTFRIIAIDNRVDILQNVSNSEEELPSENDFINISIEIANRIVRVLECNCIRYAFAPEYVINGTQEEFDRIYNSLCKDDEVPFEWILLKTKQREIGNLFINVSKRIQMGFHKFNYEVDLSKRIMLAFDINTPQNEILTNEEMNTFFENANQLLNEEKDRLN